MNNNVKVIVLGGTSAHIGLIQRLKNKNYFVILIDYYDNPVGKSIADIHIKESTLDREKVLEIAKKNNINLIITTSVDQANSTAVYVLEKLGLHSPYSYQTSLDVTNKVLMKKIMKDNKIPTSDYILIKDDLIAEHDLNYPLIVKPADSNGSKGVVKVKNSNELSIHLINAIKISRTKQAILEEYKEGLEIGVDCFIKDNQIHILTIRERVKIDVLENEVQQIIRTITPARIKPEMISHIRNIISNIAKSFRLNNTPLMVQAIVNNDEINIIEFAPRIGGGESSRMIKLITGFDIIDQTINSFTGDNVEVKYNSNYKYYSEILLYCIPSIFGKVIGYERLMESRIIEYFVPYKSEGMEINSGMSSINRVGAFVVSANNIEDLNRKAKTAIDEIEVLDISGNKILLKDIYYNHLVKGE